MTVNIFFDFDGTLIDSRKRLYHLFMELAPTAKFSFEEYWDIKRQRISQAELLKKYLNYTPEAIHDFSIKWKEEVEAPHRIATDLPFKDSEKVLRMLAGHYHIHLVTARQNTDTVHKQLAHFGWTNIFTSVLVTNQLHSKSSLIQNQTKFDNTDFFIGDTGEDIMTAKELGLSSIAVSSGILSADVLKTYEPDYLLNGVSDLASFKPLTEEKN